MLRAKLRKMQSWRHNDFQRTVIDFFNLVLGNSPESDQFWSTKIKIYLVLKFTGKIFSEEEKINEDDDLRYTLMMNVVILF